MNKPAMLAGIIVAVIAVAILGINAYLHKAEAPGGNIVTAQYFQEQMNTIGVADIGMPIEGFDAYLMILAYPGLKIEDFEGVETFEGKYTVKNGKLEFERTQEQPISSAERTVSEKGYETLLKNVSARLGIQVETPGGVDELIQKINTGELIRAGINETASALDVSVTPQALLEDSRCPMDVQCIQAGTVRVRALLQSGLGSGEQIFQLDQPITTEAEQVTLKQVSPDKEAQTEIKIADYEFVFEVIKRQDQ